MSGLLLFIGFICGVVWTVIYKEIVVRDED